jgi:metal-sulfur cluster biosynthetic enzyme
MAHRRSDADADTDADTSANAEVNADAGVGVDLDGSSRASAGNEGRLTREAVLERLDRVSDPELDRSIVELEYVDEIDIKRSNDGANVFVRFKLPTAWCSPTFAWMMATGIRDEAEELPGVSHTEVELIDHMHTAEINEGVNARVPFEAAFEDATEGIEETRRTLDRKARLARQHRTIEALLDAGMQPEQIVSLTPADVGFPALPAEGKDIEVETDESGAGEDDVAISLAEGALYVRVPREPIAAYLVKAIETDLVGDAEDVLFATPDGDPIQEDEFDLVQHRARAASVNQTGQGGVCASLHEARYGIGADEPAG